MCPSHVGYGGRCVLNSMKNETNTECKSYEGVTVGLIDSLMSIAKVIREREAQAEHDGNYSEAVEQALEDLRQDDDMAWLMNWDAENGASLLKAALNDKKDENKLLRETIKALTRK